MSRLAVFMRSLVHKDLAVAPEVSSEVFAISLNMFTRAPVESLPLHAYPDTYLLVAIISSTEGLSGPFLERIKEISPLALRACVWFWGCWTSMGWSLSIFKRREPFLSLTRQGASCKILTGDSVEPNSFLHTFFSLLLAEEWGFRNNSRNICVNLFC